MTPVTIVDTREPRPGLENTGASDEPVAENAEVAADASDGSNSDCAIGTERQRAPVSGLALALALFGVARRRRGNVQSSLCASSRRNS